MANMVIPNEGKQKWLDAAVHPDGVTPEDYVVDLFQNNYTPVDSSTGSNFTVASYGGYAEVIVPRSSFSASTIASNIANALSSVSPAFSQTSGATQTVYGWYMRGATSGKVYAAAVFDSPIASVVGMTITLSPFQVKLQTFH